MYSGYKILNSSREKLLELFPPKYATVICHHITEQYPVSSKNDVPEQPENVEVIGYLDDGIGIECLLVSIDGKTKRPDGKIYHITLSLDSMLGYKPVSSNDLIANSYNTYKKVNKISIQTKAQVFN